GPLAAPRPAGAWPRYGLHDNGEPALGDPHLSVARSAGGADAARCAGRPGECQLPRQWRAGQSGLSRFRLRPLRGRRRSGSVLAARRPIEAGVRFVTIGLGGWDTHLGNFRTLRFQLLPQLDQALSALIDDLDGRGLLDRTVVYCAGEFGRTPLINGGAGRDHW